MREKYPVYLLCQEMNVNRSGYYKWKACKGLKNQYERDRELLTELLREVHERYRSYGYHRLAAVVRRETGWLFSDNLAHKCCKYAGIHSKARHYKYRKAGKENIIYPNLIRNHWNAKQPLEIVVSDMTCLRHKGHQYEWTYLLDTYNNEILSHHLTSRPGDRRPYFCCLKDLKKKIEEQTTPLVLHTDQGSVYSSRAFLEAHKDCNILRSMSRAGTPTDNPIIESINGWIKAEMGIDFAYWKEDNIFDFVDHYVEYYNNQRPAYALKYQSPVQYRTERGFG